MFDPEILTQAQCARVKQIAIFKGFVVLVVLGRQAQSAGFDAHIDVFGDQHHFAWRMQFPQSLDHPQDLVVCFALG